MTDSTTLWIFGVVFTLGQAVVLFVWNNLKADLKSDRLSCEAALAKIESHVEVSLTKIATSVESDLKSISTLVGTKATNEEMAQRRGDIKELFTKDELLLNKLAGLKQELLEKMTSLEINILRGMHDQRASRPRSRS